jgi:ribonuclease Z
MLKAGAMKPVLDKLTTPEQAAQVFTKAAPRLAVFSHTSRRSFRAQPATTCWNGPGRPAMGPLRMGIDCMMIDVGQEVAVSAPLPTHGMPEPDKLDAKFLAWSVGWRSYR